MDQVWNACRHLVAQSHHACQVPVQHALHTLWGTFHPQPGNGNPSGPTGHGASKPGMPCYHGNKCPKPVSYREVCVNENCDIIVHCCLKQLTEMKVNSIEKPWNAIMLVIYMTYCHENPWKVTNFQATKTWIQGKTGKLSSLQDYRESI
jgi:hypothetical protein